jgi:5-methylcytosine-specific restriction endonuclease McrA
MNTIICTLKHKGPEYKGKIDELNRKYQHWKISKNKIITSWSLNNATSQTKENYKLGDRIFLVLQGWRDKSLNKVNNLVFGSGVVLNTPLTPKNGKYEINIEIDYLVDPMKITTLGMKRYSSSLKSNLIKHTFWINNGSGWILKKKDQKVIQELEKSWKNYSPSFLINIPTIFPSTIITPIPNPIFKPVFSGNYQKGINNVKKVPKTCPTPLIKKNKNTRSGYDRNHALGKYIINAAGYQCEVNNNHNTFTWDNKGNQYMESHHLIPMKEQGSKIYKSIPLDRQENIICLCPNCHRKFHSAIDKEKKQLIDFFFIKRKSVLQKSGIIIDQSKLYKYYNCK